MLTFILKSEDSYWTNSYEMAIGWLNFFYYIKKNLNTNAKQTNKQKSKLK